jgi:hypothetical protein
MTRLQELEAAERVPFNPTMEPALLSIQAERRIRRAAHPARGARRARAEAGAPVEAAARVARFNRIMERLLRSDNARVIDAA